MKTFLDILNIARENVKNNPGITKIDSVKAAHQYLDGLKDEVEEVKVEVKENNEVYLTDELSDIAWDYATLLSVLEDRGLIGNAEDVLAHGFQKYTERLPSAAESTVDSWNEIKEKQKIELKKKHAEKYGG
jgi:hypothetical protein